jgi:hypothetical protein
MPAVAWVAFAATRSAFAGSTLLQGDVQDVPAADATVELQLALETSNFLSAELSVPVADGTPEALLESSTVPLQV